MSGLDKFFKTPAKPLKKPAAKAKEKKIQSESPPKRGKKSETQESDEKKPADESPTSAPQIDESENVTEFADLPPDAPTGEEGLMINNEVPARTHKFSKFQLHCTNKKCNYKRILMKSVLSSSDLTCPKCGNQMHQK